MGEARASIVVKFGDVAADDQFAVVELDEIANSEATTFAPGQDAWFMVHLGPKLKITSVRSSSGTVRDAGGASRTRTQQVQFAAVLDNSDLPHYPSGQVDIRWFGRNGLTALSGRTLTAQAAPSIGGASYQVAFRRYCLTPPAMTLAEDEEWPILVVVEVDYA